MTYPCGCSKPWTSFDHHEPGALCEYHAAWCIFADRLENLIDDMRADDFLKQGDDPRDRSIMLSSLMDIRGEMLDLSTPQEPEPPDRETEIEDGEYRPHP
jgi:hypothetical protein